MFNPCYEYCYLRFGKQYTEDCNNTCEYAKQVNEKNKLEEQLKSLTEELNRPIETLEELTSYICTNVECENCPVMIHKYESRIEHEKTCLQEPCCTNLYRWIIEQVKNIKE